MIGEEGLNGYPFVDSEHHSAAREARAAAASLAIAAAGVLLLGSSQACIARALAPSALPSSLDAPEDEALDERRGGEPKKLHMAWLPQPIAPVDPVRLQATVSVWTFLLVALLAPVSGWLDGDGGLGPGTAMRKAVADGLWCVAGGGVLAPAVGPGNNGTASMGAAQITEIGAGAGVVGPSAGSPGGLDLLFGGNGCRVSGAATLLAAIVSAAARWVFLYCGEAAPEPRPGLQGQPAGPKA